MYRPIVDFPTVSATSAHTVLTEKVSAWVRGMSPKDSPLSFCRGTPEMIFPLRPLTVESGVYLPESIAAISVTTLNVEPGGELDWVERLNTRQPGAPFGP